MQLILNQPQRETISSQRGFSLIEFLVSAGLLMVAMGGLAAGGSIASMLKNQQDSMAALVSYRNVIIASLRGSDSLARTAAGNTCLAKREGCTNMALFADLTVVNGDGSLTLTHATAPEMGFRLDGKQCSTFPSEACPFRYNVAWRSTCSALDAGCAVPQIAVQGRLEVADQFKAPVQKRKYGFQLNIGQIIGNYEQVCSAAGGNYVSGVPPACVMPAGIPCGVGEAAIGYDPVAKGPICRSAIWSWGGGTCAPGFVAIGVTLGGAVDCRPMTPNGPCMGDPNSAACRPFDCQFNPAACPPAPAIDGGGSQWDGGCGDGC